MTVTVIRASGSAPIGVELDVWAREPTAAAEVIVGGVVEGSASDGWLQVGDAIRGVNGVPCCTIEDVRRLLGTSIELNFEICRPTQAELHASDTMMRTSNGAWVKARLCLRSSRLLEICEEGFAAERIQIRRAKSVSIHPGRELRLSTADGLNIIFKTGSTADLERWHTLLTQMTMFHPGMRCDLSGWLQRADGAADPSRRYFELYTNGTALVYASPHRNKLGQALLAVALAQCSVEADPRDPGAWIIGDVDRDGTVWRCSSLQPTNSNESVDDVLLAHRVKD